MIGPRNDMQLLVKRGRVEGLVVFDYAKRFPEALRMLFDRRNKGKLVVKIK